MQDTTRYTTSTSLHAAILSAAVTAWDKAENPDVPYGHITFRHASGSIKLLNTKERLQQFASQMMRSKASWALWGGGNMPAELAKPRKAKPATTWQTTAVNVCVQLFEDKQNADGLAMALDRLGGRAYWHNEPGKKNEPFLMIAPQPVAGLPERLASGRHAIGGAWSVYDTISGLAVGNSYKPARSRAAAERLALDLLSEKTPEQLETAFNRAKPNDAAEALARLCQVMGINDTAEALAAAQAQAEADALAAEAQAKAEADAAAAFKTADATPTPWGITAAIINAALVFERCTNILNYDANRRAAIEAGRQGKTSAMEYIKTHLAPYATAENKNMLAREQAKVALAVLAEAVAKAEAQAAAPVATPADAVAALVADAVAAVAIDAAQATARGVELATVADVASTGQDVATPAADAQAVADACTEADADTCTADAVADATEAQASTATPGHTTAPRAMASTAGAQPGTPGSTGTARTTGTAGAQPGHGGGRGQLVAGKSGRWVATFHTTAAGLPGMLYTGPDGVASAHEFDTGSARMAALQRLARAADAPAKQQRRQYDGFFVRVSKTQAETLWNAGEPVAMLAYKRDTVKTNTACAESQEFATFQEKAQAGESCLRYGEKLYFYAPQAASTTADTGHAMATDARLQHLAAFDPSGVDVWQCSTREVQAMAEADFVALVQHLENVNHHTAALCAKCLRAGCDDLAEACTRLENAHVQAGQLTPALALARFTICRLLRGESVNMAEAGAGSGLDACEVSEAVALVGNAYPNEKAAATPHTPPPSAADAQATPPVCAADAGDYTHPLKTLAADYTDPLKTLGIDYTQPLKTLAVPPATPTDWQALVGAGVTYTGDACNAPGNGAIVAVHETPCGRAAWLTVDVMLEDGRHPKALRLNAFGDKPGDRYRLRPMLHGAPYLAQLAAAVAMREANRTATKAMADKAHADTTARLAVEFAHLERAENNHRGGTFAARNIRTELKRAFQGVKFSVTSDYSSVRVKWTDGPTDAQVNDVIGRFSTGASDTQSDYFYTVETAFSKLFGGVQYLFTDRNTSEAFTADVLAAWWPTRGESATQPTPTAQDWKKGEGLFSWRTGSDGLRDAFRKHLRETAGPAPTPTKATRKAKA